MKNKKLFILLVEYNSIRLFKEENDQITNINFSNGKNALSNCVAFSYEREDLEFLPDGDPFETNSNSSFSDYLNFAGYHFDAIDALEVIVASIVQNKLIPSLDKNDDIIVCTDEHYYEANHLYDNTNEKIVIASSGKRKIANHNVYFYDVSFLIYLCIDAIRLHLGSNILIGYPLLTIFVQRIEDMRSVLIAPTIDYKAVEKINDKYPLPTHIPEKLLRNIKNRIIISKLFNLPLPDKAVYQNRVIDIAHAEFAEYFDEIIKEDIKLLEEKEEFASDGPTYIFDFGMHPVLKDYFLSLIKNPVFIDKSENIKLTLFILRCVLIEHLALNDVTFLSNNVRREKEFEEVHLVMKAKSATYYDVTLIREYYATYAKKNLFNNPEFKVFEGVKNE